MLSLILTAAMLATAQAPAAPGDLVVTGYYWGRVDNPAMEEDREPVPVSQWGRPATDKHGNAIPPLLMLRREGYMLVRNTGKRKVKAVTWSYVFYEDAKREKELRRFQFKTKASVGPGEMKFVVETVDSAAPSPYGAVTIDRVEYEDGTAWAPARSEVK